jgi:RNA polymerase sigma-70 factor (ECF subfamily)
MGEEVNRHQIERDEDFTLIKAFNEGDENAFDKLVIKYKDRVFNLCYRFLENYEEADDATQEAFVRVYSGLKHFRFASAFSTWLYRIAVNICKNKFLSLEYRLKRKTMHLEVARDDPEQDTGVLEIKDNSLSPDREVERREREKIIEEAIASLPEQQRLVVVLRDIQGLSYEEIAKITGYNLGTVKSKLSRGRLSLREKLEGLI